MSDYLITKAEFSSKMNILIYGEPGSGKTYLAGTAQDVPSMANVHFLDIDGGMMTLASRGDIRATNVRSVDELEEEFRKIASGDPKYEEVRTIVIDNISELQTLSLEGIVFKEYSNRVRKDKGYTLDEVYIEDYGISSKQLSRILRGFRDLPINVIYLAHKKDKMRKGTNILEESKPNLTEKLCTAVMGYMDMVMYLYTADEMVDIDGVTTPVLHRYLLTQPMNNYAAKTRDPGFAKRLGPILKDPTFTQIHNTFTGE